MIFVDSGAFLARQIKADQFHAAALTIWDQLQKSGEPLATSQFVVAEVVNLISRRVSRQFAARVGRTLYTSAGLSILRSDQQIETQALLLFESTPNSSVGFIDGLSFMLMKRHGITTAFTFDQHFRTAGFETIPE